MNQSLLFVLDKREKLANNIIEKVNFISENTELSMGYLKIYC